MQRKAFLLGAVSGLAVVGCADGLFARALAQPAAGASDGRVLVIVNLQGGNDGLNTLVPFASSSYYSYRPTLAVRASDVLRIDNAVGLNPALKPLKDLYDKGMVAIVQGVGYPNPDFSHFRGTAIWQTAAPEKYLTTGWLGRYLDTANLPQDNLFNALAVANVLPEVLIAAHTDVPAVAQVGSYGLASDRKGGVGRDEFHAFVQDANLPFTSPYLAQVAAIEDHAQRGAEELPQLIAGYQPGGTYPGTPLGRSLALTAQIVGSRLGTRVIYVQHGSFDTHTTQQGTQDRLLAEFGDALAAFYADLAAHGNDKRVLTVTFSEFGRRVAENGSRGTDHGTAAPLFAVGGAVKGGLYGTYPSLDNLDNGNLRFSTDFRAVYASVLERWLERPAAPILGGTFEPLPLLA